MREENVDMKNKNKKNDKPLHFMLLPLATILYVYGVASWGIVAAITIAFAIRRDWAILDGNTTGTLLLVLLGTIIFFPAKKFRARMLEN